MTEKSCLAERISSLGVGTILLVLGILMAVFSLIALPFIGLVVGAPLLICACFLIVAARRAECPLE